MHLKGKVIMSSQRQSNYELVDYEKLAAVQRPMDRKMVELRWERKRNNWLREKIKILQRKSQNKNRAGQQQVNEQSASLATQRWKKDWQFTKAIEKWIQMRAGKKWRRHAKYSIMEVEWKEKVMIMSYMGQQEPERRRRTRRKIILYFLNIIGGLRLKCFRCFDSFGHFIFPNTLKYSTLECVLQL